jgi:hypothetical protein
LLFSYYENSAEVASILDREIAKTRQLSVDDAEDFINPVANTPRLIAGMAAADPALFRTEESRELLYRAVTSSEQIDAVYASFEDGFHRVVTRIDDDRRRSDPQIPAAANWHSSYIDAVSAGENRRRQRTFFDTWPNVVEEYSVATKFDERSLPEYRNSRRLPTSSRSIDEPPCGPAIPREASTVTPLVATAKYWKYFPATRSQYPSLPLIPSNS